MVGGYFCLRKYFFSLFLYVVSVIGLYLFFFLFGCVLWILRKKFFNIFMVIWWVIVFILIDLLYLFLYYFFSFFMDVLVFLMVFLYWLVLLIFLMLWVFVWLGIWFFCWLIIWGLWLVGIGGNILLFFDFEKLWLFWMDFGGLKGGKLGNGW